MSSNDQFFELNRVAWDAKASVHPQTEFYQMQSFLEGQTSLKHIELGLLGDVSGASILHLQCHFGQDSLSLARMGAQVTGVDISSVAITKAKELNEQLGLNARFFCSDVFSFPDKHTDKYDIVFTSYGVLGWLPDLDPWAQVVSHFLKPGGKLILVEFHPVVWMLDEDFSYIKYSYEKSDPIIEEIQGTYADTSSVIKTTTVSWNHSLSETINALIGQNINMIDFKEYNYSPYPCFSCLEKIQDEVWVVKHLARKIPMTFSIVAQKSV
jgi:2-polyprenyl-3-methyl-5-hydroxy-6-metoxy-1,4-benzoquinol methylase